MDECEVASRSGQGHPLTEVHRPRDAGPRPSQQPRCRIVWCCPTPPPSVVLTHRRQRELSSSDEEHLRSREAQREEREIASLQPVLLGAEPQGEGDGPCTRPPTTFADVAGMEGVKAALREMVLLPLLAPQVLQDMGISAPRQGREKEG